MKNILIAQVGRGTYLDTEYSNGDALDNLINTKYIEDFNKRIYKTGYTFEATYREIQEKYKEDISNIVLIGTDESYWGSIYLYYYNKFHKENKAKIIAKVTGIGEEIVNNLIIDEGNSLSRCGIGIKSSENIEIIREELSKIICKCLGREEDKEFIKICTINYGTNRDELQNNFIKLKEQFSEIINKEQNNQEYRVFFDISNGFRSLPMYIYNFGNYMLTVWNAKVEMHMYYGMLDGRRKVDAPDKSKHEIAPIVDLEDVNDLMRWINAANEFNNYGAVREIVNILKLDSNMKWNKEIGHSVSNNQYALADIFSRFDYASNANNLRILRETIDCIIKIEKEIVEINEVPQYARELLMTISRKFKDTFDQSHRNKELINDPNIFSVVTSKPNYSYSYLTIMLSKYYFEQDRVGHAAIALQEGVTTYIMERWTSFISDFLKNSEGIVLQNNPGLEEWEEWLFEYKGRERVAKWYKNVPSNYNTLNLLQNASGISELSFLYKMNIVREVIRNQEAHILANNITEIEIENSKEVLLLLINEMIERVRGICTAEESIFDNAYGLYRDYIENIDFTTDPSGNICTQNKCGDFILNNSNLIKLKELSNEMRVIWRFAEDVPQDSDASAFQVEYSGKKNTDYSKLREVFSIWKPSVDFETNISSVKKLLKKDTRIYKRGYYSLFFKSSGNNSINPRKFVDHLIMWFELV